MFTFAKIYIWNALDIAFQNVKIFAEIYQEKQKICISASQLYVAKKIAQFCTISSQTLQILLPYVISLPIKYNLQKSLTGSGLG